MDTNHAPPAPPFHCLQYRFINEKLGIKAIWKHQEVNFGMDIKVAYYVLCHNLERECTNVVTNAAKQLCYEWYTHTAVSSALTEGKS